MYLWTLWGCTPDTPTITYIHTYNHLGSTSATDLFRHIHHREVCMHVYRYKTYVCTYVTGSMVSFQCYLHFTQTLLMLTHSPNTCTGNDEHTTIHTYNYLRTYVRTYACTDTHMYVRTVPYTLCTLTWAVLWWGEGWSSWRSLQRLAHGKYSYSSVRLWHPAWRQSSPHPEEGGGREGQPSGTLII